MRSQFTKLHAFLFLAASCAASSAAQAAMVDIYVNSNDPTIKRKLSSFMTEAPHWTMDAAVTSGGSAALRGIYFLGPMTNAAPGDLYPLSKINQGVDLFPMPGLLVMKGSALTMAGGGAVTLTYAQPDGSKGSQLLLLKKDGETWRALKSDGKDAINSCEVELTPDSSGFALAISSLVCR